MENDKPRLSLDEQIQHLKGKGILFNIIDEGSAKQYLKYNNNYYKLTSFRKNYDRHPGGENKGKYIRLEFTYLVDMSIIDMRLRYRIVEMALDIEHHMKLQLLRKMMSMMRMVIKLSKIILIHWTIGIIKFFSEINRNKRSIYCRDIIEKYEGNYPVWAFIEIVSFGELVGFYHYCAKRYSDKEMVDDYYRLLTCKKIRNGAAHSNSILNDLRPHTAEHHTNKEIIKELVCIPDMNSNFRKNKMSNARIQQIITLLYMHKKIVRSEGVALYESGELKKLMRRIDRNSNYYKTK
ncbi:Abi family protein [Catenibacterium mitsuokai]|uniref:Abi family protein n=1 Tax=Catenibacterium mitsuokai TaxID=100886 RepID=UPI0022E3F127|nr:Abi family protein [Catenibacterium mitsuokai]